MRDPPDAATLRALAASDGDAPAAARALAEAVLAREARAGDAPVRAWATRLAALCGDTASFPEVLERRLVAALRAGALDHGPRRAALRAHLIATVRARLDEVAPELAASWPIFAEETPS